MLIKSRVAKKSNRGVYLQDRQLQQTKFSPGTPIKYVIDKDNRKIIILPTDESTNTVSKRSNKDGINPVIDIRSKEALAAFEHCKYLQVEIHDDHVVVSGYQEETEKKSLSLVSQVKRAVEKIVTRTTKIVDIQQFLNVRKTQEIVLRKSDLKKVVGGSEQLSLFSLESLDAPAGVASFAAAIQNIHIPLLLGSLFSGAGFLDLGFKKAGFDIAFAVEKDADAVKTYRWNLGTHIIEADITTILWSLFPKPPVMIGGSPCQGFSNSNRYTHFLDNPNNMLVRSYIDAIKANDNCQVFVLENVPQITTAGEGQFKNEIIEALSEFEVSVDVLNAADYGSPQTRKRAIFIGSKIGKIELPRPTVSPSQYMTVREALAGLHDGIPNQLEVSVPKDLTLERIRSVPPGGNVHDIPAEIRPKGQHSDMYKRFEWDKPAVTIVNPRKAMLLHPEEDRILSIRECARIQGVDDDFEFQGNLNSKQQQVANGVPVHLAYAVATAVKNAIMQFNIRNRKTSFAF